MKAGVQLKKQLANQEEEKNTAITTIKEEYEQKLEDLQNQLHAKEENVKEVNE